MPAIGTPHNCVSGAHDPTPQTTGLAHIDDSLHVIPGGRERCPFDQDCLPACRWESSGTPSNRQSKALASVDPGGAPEASLGCRQHADIAAAVQQENRRFLAVAP
jgi:hypothetical protein